MHPYTTKGRSGQLSSIFFESLLEGTADEADAVYGLVAESLEYPEDRSHVIFNMRPEARFSDGTPLTADDVVFSYETLRDKGLPSFRAVIQKQVESAEALGPHRVKFTFKEGVPTRDLPQTVGGLPIFSKAYYERTGADFEASTLSLALGRARMFWTRLRSASRSSIAATPTIGARICRSIAAGIISTAFASNISPITTAPLKASRPAPTHSGMRLLPKSGRPAMISQPSTRAGP